MNSHELELDVDADVVALDIGEVDLEDIDVDEGAGPVDLLVTTT